MAELAKKPATYADVLAAPENLVAEIIDGELVTHPRPSPRHGLAATALSAELAPPFQRGQGGPGGWIFIVEPELHLGEDVVVPDVAAWRVERLAGIPERGGIKVVPDWVCEVLSASTERRDRGVKRHIYARAGVGHLWLLDPRHQSLEVSALEGGRWVFVGAWNSDETVGAPPFEAFSFSLADLWPLDRPLGFGESPQRLFAGDR
jgi:Uma2 family endonuclease